MAGEVQKAALEEVVSALGITWHRVECAGDIPPLEAGRIHLCVLDLAELDCEKLVDQEDYVRGQRIRDAEKRRLYLGGRYGLKTLLWMYTGIRPRDLRFGYGTRGKPRLLSGHPGDPIEFNYTLSGDKVLYGFSRARPLGVDMEVLPRRINADRMAATRLTREERRAWQALPGHLRNDGMLCCWTRKEAYGKALGVGIRFRLGDVSLFRDLQQPAWQTPRTGLFDTTDTAAMPEYLQGVQLSLPFDGVASVMYASEKTDVVPPDFHMMQLGAF